ncbi:MAG TPA: 3-oxoacyl-ACP reductase family protein [Rubrobacteraceae bacterium]|nr:3-oxoacyl-ACP reductase family protein [Rubrobacteraceae bacterium]
MFDGDVAWVTGSSKGIGRAVALDLAREGCDVAVHYNSGEDEAREVVEQIEALGRRAFAVRGDVSDGAEVKRMVREIEDRFGRVDVLVNNAGSFVERRTLEEMTEDVWDRVMAVNLKSVYLCSQAVLHLMRRQGGGKIVNISSVSARIGGSPDSIAYSTAKGGVSTLTRAMAKALLPDNILVNAVAPGRIDTPLHDRFTPAEKREEGARKVPLGREGTPEEVSGAVVYLASDRASYLVGEVIEVNGGLWMG